MPQASREVRITNARGLHARPAMQFVDVANTFAADVRVIALGEERTEADAKSIMQMMTLAAVEGTPLQIVADGADAEAAVASLAALVEAKFGEE